MTSGSRGGLVPLVPPMPVVVPAGVTGLPLPSMRPARESAAVYSVRQIDCDMRVHARHLLDALGWRRGDAVQWHARGGLLLVTSSPGDAGALGASSGLVADGKMYVPARARSAAQLERGDRMLLVAGLLPGILAAVPLGALDEILLPHLTRAAEGSAP
ncbi:hypothetical protein [Nocardia sp. alder85J]|uniref:hypothetical protein n=1 Tax=Nocardia sp. alder85J TaxID=2862949 RepID=UPI001CD56554|nr:hypothetical protein [Nocardia sp. alder85J]MCX4097788.1 hypothetical protein [Nocardia sp. alder85J]